MGQTSIRRGLLAGAAGTVALNAVSYLDMALRGRPASDLPRRTVEAGLGAAGTGLPGRGQEREARGEAWGALAGIGAGLGVGVVTSAARRAGLRLSPVSGAVVTGAVAMLATDGPAAALGVTDPGSWGLQEWVGDATPHLAYGLVAHETIRRQDRSAPTTPVTTRPSAGLLLRSLLLGVATGSRSSLGVAGAALASRGPNLAKAAAATGVAAELVADKLPATPSRLGSQGLVPRFGSASLGATALAARENAVCDLPVAAAAAGTAVGAWAGAAWREVEWQTPLVRALVEDVVAVGLTALAVRRA